MEAGQRLVSHHLHVIEVNQARVACTHCDVVATATWRAEDEMSEESKKWLHSFRQEHSQDSCAIQETLPVLGKTIVEGWHQFVPAPGATVVVKHGLSADPYAGWPEEGEPDVPSHYT